MDASLLTIILLGIVEGLTEFIPVSSTGHLVLAGELLGFNSDAGTTFDIVIQLGAILAVVVLYWRRFFDVAMGLVRAEPGAIAFTRNVLLGFLPAMAIGFFVYDYIKQMLESPAIVAVALTPEVDVPASGVMIEETRTTRAGGTLATKRRT